MANDCNEVCCFGNYMDTLVRCCDMKKKAAVMTQSIFVWLPSRYVSAKTDRSYLNSTDQGFESVPYNHQQPQPITSR